MPINHVYNEKELLVRLSNGEESAFSIIVRQYSGLLFTYIHKITKDQEVAADVVQEIFTQIWLTRESITGIDSFRAYLFVISRNHALRSLKNIDKEYQKRQEWWRLKGEHFDSGDAAEQATEAGIVDNLVQDAINQLPPQQKKAWLMSRQQGKKYAEIAQEMELSRETVKKYLQLASASISEYIKNNGFGMLLTYIITKL